MALLTGKIGADDLYALGPNFKDAKTLAPYVASKTGLALNIGLLERKNQAIGSPSDYIADKTALWNSILSGAKGTGKELKIKLPGMADNSIPAMTGLANEFKNSFLALVGSGVDRDVALAQAEVYIKGVLNQRISQFATAFPGFVDESYNAAMSNAITRNYITGQEAGLNPATTPTTEPTAAVRDFESKYKKYKAKYRKRKTKKQ